MPRFNASHPTTIIDCIPAPPGWHACYRNRSTDGGKEYTTLPVALWVTVDLTTTIGTVERTIRPYVARVTGQVMDATDVEREFLCLVPPTFDTHKTVMALLSREADVWNEALVS